MVNLVGRLLGAVLLGFGTVFQPKPRPEDHWSSSPKIVLVIEAEDDDGDPLRPRPSRDPSRHHPHHHRVRRPSRAHG